MEAQCIMVDHPDHLYITDNYVVTHNSSILNALSYVIFDAALTKIRKDNLVNKTNEKEMFVTLDFEKNGVNYKIERGRKRNVTRFWVNNSEFVTQTDDTDEAQGDSRVTQVEIEKVIGFSHSMFKNIIGLNTYSEPFLSMRANDQREIIEQLLGITKLSEKAELLRVLLKDTKDKVKEEEYKIKSIQDANNTIESNINMLLVKSDNWQQNHERDIVDTYQAIEKLMQVDIDQEIRNHELIASAHAQTQKYKEYSKDVSGYEREIKLYQRSNDSLAKQLEATNDSICHTCGSELHDEEKHKEIEAGIIADIEKNQAKIEEKQIKLAEAKEKLDSIVMPETDGLTTFYPSVSKAYEHKSSISSLESHLAKLAEGENPFLDQIESLRNEGLRKIENDHLEDLVSLRDHQEFLLKLLTNKDSFIRKKIIDQNLNYLNARLDHYLTKIGLPHEVRFVSDLSVDITEHGRELDFDNLSRGERTRLILSLSWAFRDVYESLNDRVNLLFIDELMDNGLDTNGVESSLSVLKSIVRDTKKSVFLISHREELLGRVDNIVKVIKENGFTSIEQQS
jgi:DNA repair exonuclease SbcCD ATPase subunit